MIQSYFFDPVQVSSPGYINEVNSCKLDEDNAVKLKCDVLVHKNDLQRESFKRITSWNRKTGGLLPQGTGKTDSDINGIGPAVIPQPAGDPGYHQGDRGFWTISENSVHSSPPSLDKRDTGEQDSEHPALGEPQVTHNGVFRAPSKAEHPFQGELDHGHQIPAPDYPQPWNSVKDSISHREQGGLSQSLTVALPPEGLSPKMGEQGLHVPFPRRSWDSLIKVTNPEALSISFLHMAPAPVARVTNSRNGWMVVPGSPGDKSEEVLNEDEAVAEALAALEAATAGEDEDEGD